MRLDLDLTPDAGLAVARRKLEIALPANYELSFRLRSQASSGSLQLRFIDGGGAAIWHTTPVSLEQGRDWTEVVRRQRHVSLAAGTTVGQLTRVSAIEIAVRIPGGGRGTLWIDELVLRPREPAQPYALVPRVVGTPASPGHEGIRALDGDSTTSWRAPAVAAARPAATEVAAPGGAAPSSGATPPSLLIDFQRPRELGGLVIDWERGRAAVSYSVEYSADGKTWVARHRVSNGDGGRDHIYLPESGTRFLRLVLDRAQSDSTGLRELAVKPVEWSASLDDFLAAVAADAPPGSYPKYLTGLPTSWTALGADADRVEALLNEEGMIDAGPGRFSIEPFVFVDGRLVTWRDVRITQSLRGSLPSPTVEWDGGEFSLTIDPLAVGVADSSAVYANYAITNRRSGRRRFTLYLAVRPFQVSPPWQRLDPSGGATPIHDVSFDGRTVRVNSTDAVVPLVAPTGFGGATFDQGNIVDYLRSGRLPLSREVRDPFGQASAALSFEVDADSGKSSSVGVAIPLHPAALGMIQRDRALASAAADRRRAELAGSRAPPLGRVGIELPASAQRLTNAMRANLGYVLINRDGPALKAGSRVEDYSAIGEGALMSSTLLRLGRGDLVRAFIEWYAAHQRPNGKVPCCVGGEWRGAVPVSEEGSHGAFIYLVAEYWRHTHDRALVDRVWPNVARAVTHLDSLRRSRMTGEYVTGTKRLEYGLLPARSGRGAAVVAPVHLYQDDVVALGGMRDAAELSSVLGRPELQSYASSRDELRSFLYESIRTAMARHKVDFLPSGPESPGYDALFASLVVTPMGEAARLPPPALERTIERYWADFLAARDTAAAGRPTSELRLVGTLVRLGQRERAHTLLDWFLSRTRPAGWSQWAGTAGGGAGASRFVGDMPDATAGSAFIGSVLDMLAYEREADSSLVVGAGIPEAWANERPGVTVRGLSTHYGLLSFTVRRENDGVRVSLQHGLRLPPGGIVVEAPFAEQPRQKLVNGIPASGPSATSVVVRSLPAEVVFRR